MVQFDDVQVWLTDEKQNQKENHITPKPYS
jgi:hypothetical protein